MFESVKPKDEAFEERIARLHLIGDAAAITFIGIANVAIAAIRAYSQQGYRVWFSVFCILGIVATLTIVFVRLSKLTKHLDCKTSKQFRESAVSLALTANIGIMVALNFS